LKIKDKTITTDTTIIDQMNKFFRNCLDFELVAKKLGKIKIKTNTKKITGNIWSNCIF
tara:strand:- start:165 stop:338 length:174 start_codon:yes stop_codon:yes gene_type:complete